MENTNIDKVKKEPMTTKQKVVFGLKIAGNVIFYVVIILLFLFSIMNINAGGKGGIPNLFGRGYLSVQSDSMTRAGDMPNNYDEYKIGAFAKGDLVKVTMLNEKSLNKLEKGDVVTFYDEKLKAFNTHRIVIIEKDSNGVVKSLTCQGDFTVSALGYAFDPNDTEHSAQMNTWVSNGDVQTFAGATLSDVKAKVTSVSYGAGKVMDNIQQNWLFYFVLPVLALLLFEVFMVIKNFMDLRAEKNKASLATDKEAMMAELASEKEKMRQELLAELKAQQEANKDSKKDEEESDK